VRPTQATERTLRVQGIELFVREQGAGHPLLMVNGIGADAEMWGQAERTLASSSRTIVFDWPGTGRSQTPLYPRSLPGLARLVVALLDTLGHPRVDVLGFSFGGALAQQLANDAPQRVRRLALVSTSCGWGGTPADVGTMTAAALPYRRGVANPLGYAYQLWAFATWSSLLWLSRVDVPTLVVAGVRDRLVPPRNAVQLARRLPHSSLHLLPAAEHLHMFDPDAAAARLLAEFFSSESLAHSTAWQTGLLSADAAG
jgi:pimeloyl-ACP methyl ester carboxylesterase